MTGAVNYAGYGLDPQHLHAIQSFVQQILDTGNLSNASFGNLTDATTADIPTANASVGALKTRIAALEAAGTGGGSGGPSSWGAISGSITAQTDLAAALNAKANTSTVNSALAGKADTTTVNTALASKADTSTVTAKADTTTVNNALALKADLLYIPATITSSLINPAQPLNELVNITADTTFTFSSTPSNGTFFGAYLKNSDTADHTINIPSSFSIQQQQVITSFVLPAGAEIFLNFRRKSAGYTVWGEPVPFAQKAIAAFFPEGGNDTQVLVQYMPHAGTITTIVTQAVSGTATYTTKINGVAVTATANSVSASENIRSVTALGVFAAGDTISVTRSADSSAVDVAYTAVYTPVKP